MVLLVRHGKTPTTGKVLPGRAPGLHLSDEGQAQAEAVAAADRRQLASGRRAPVAVYASPWSGPPRRPGPSPGGSGCGCGPTAASSSATSASGPGPSCSRLAKKPEWTQVQRSPSGFRFPGGESFLEMQARMSSAIDRLVRLHRGETIVAVSHADPIKAALSTAAGTPLDLFQRLVVSPCSVSAVAYGEAGPHVLTVNSDGLARPRLAIA